MKTAARPAKGSNRSFPRPAPPAPPDGFQVRLYHPRTLPSYYHTKKASKTT